MNTKTERRVLKGGRPLRDGSRLYWWLEILAILAFYGAYSTIRNANGSHPAHAFDDARHIISLEHHLGIFHEATIQGWALHFKPLIIAANYMYGSLHFIVTIGVAVWLYRRYSNDYPRYRNTLAIATGLALIGFTIFPLMPPRLLAGSGLHLGFVDTLQRYPTPWSFDSGQMAKISNQYAAMPSVHICWSTWCAVALVPRMQTRAKKILAASYPVLTLVVIVITANHYVIDAAGGLIILSVGWIVANRLTRAGRVGETVGIVNYDP